MSDHDVNLCGSKQGKKEGKPKGPLKLFEPCTIARFLLVAVPSSGFERELSNRRKERPILQCFRIHEDVLIPSVTPFPRPVLSPASQSTSVIHQPPELAQQDDAREQDL